MLVQSMIQIHGETFIVYGFMVCSTFICTHAQWTTRNDECITAQQIFDETLRFCVQTDTIHAGSVAMLIF